MTLAKVGGAFLAVAGLAGGAAAVRLAAPVAPDSLVFTVARNGVQQARVAYPVPHDTIIPPAVHDTVVRVVHDTIVVQPPAPPPPPPPPAPPPAPPPPAPLPIPPSSAAWVVEDFAKYATTADLLKYPNPIWSGATEDVNIARIFLDPDVPPGLTGKSMRYDFAASPANCSDATIGRNVAFPSSVQEVWVEVWVKFSAGWRTKNYATACASSAGYKTIFLRTNPSSRFHIITGISETATTSYYPGDPDGGGSGFLGAPFPTQYYDGQWHRWRIHARVGATGTAVFALDNAVYKSYTNVPITTVTAIFGIALGRNLNQGPVLAQSVKWSNVRAWKSDPGWGW